MYLFRIIKIDRLLPAAEPAGFPPTPKEFYYYEYYTLDNGLLFTKEMKGLVACLGGKTKEYSIPFGVKIIGVFAFDGCSELTNVAIPDSVTDIGDYAFDGCTGLTSITIPNSVATIGDEAFCECTSLTSLTIPDSVTAIGWEAFRDCTGLTSVTIPDSVTEIGVAAFYGCYSLTDIYVNQSKSTLLDKAVVPSDCKIHWNSLGPGSV